MARIRSDERNYQVPVGLDGVVTRITPTNAALTAHLHGRFYEMSRMGNLFYVANQAATATSISVSTTHTGLALYNPVGNNKDIVLEAVGFATNLAYVALSSVGLQGHYVSTGAITAHTTPCVLGTNMGPLNLGSANAPTALTDFAATIVAPKILMMLGANAIATAISNGQWGIVDIGGAIRLQPGAYVASYTLTALSCTFSFWWSEEPR